MLIEWHSSAAAFLWRGGRQSQRDGSDSWAQVFCDETRCEVWIVIEREGFNGVERWPRIT